MNTFTLIRLGLFSLSVAPLSLNLWGVKPEFLKAETFSPEQTQEIIIDGLNGYQVPLLDRNANRDDSPFSVGGTTFLEHLLVQSPRDKEIEYAKELGTDISNYLTEQKRQLGFLLLSVEILLALLGGGIFLVTGDYSKKNGGMI